MEFDELRRVDAGPVPGEAPPGFPIRVDVQTSDPLGTLTRVRDLLRVTLANRRDTSEEDWHSLMPAWFVAACAPEPTREEADAALAQWRANARTDVAGPWSLMNWLYSFGPDVRSWWWWDGRVEGPDRIGITIVVEGHPFGSDNLRWLLETAGAESVLIDGE